MKYYDVVALRQQSGYITEVIYRNGKTEIINASAKLLLHTWCVHNGSTLEGRQDAARLLLGYHQKTPVLIDNRTDTLFFPINGVSVKENIWINYCLIAGTRHDFSKTTIVFRDGASIHVPVSYHVVKAQMIRCRTILLALNEIAWMDDENFKIIGY